MLLLTFFLIAITMAVAKVQDPEDFPDLMGVYEGMANWYEFETAPKLEDPKILHFKQNTRIEITEQEGPFIRGKEYYADSSTESGWKFTMRVFGIISRLKTWTQKDNQFSIRMQEWLNEPTKDVMQSSETMGTFTGVFYQNSSSLDDYNQMALQYTGNTKMADKYGAQHMLLRLVQ